MIMKNFFDKNRVLFGSLRYIFLIFLFTRVIFLFSGYYGKNVFSDFISPPSYQASPDGIVTMKLPSRLEDARGLNLEDFVKYDANWYFGIVRDGYLKASIREPHQRANWVFYPLFPVVISVISKIFAIDLTISSLIVTNGLFSTSLYVIYKIVHERSGEDRIARRVLLFIAMFPTSYYFSLPYTESLFLFLSSLTILSLYRRQYFASFVLAGLSAICRPPGVLNIAMALAFALFSNGRRLDRGAFRLLGFVAVSVAPMISYLVYMKSITGSYLAPMKEQYINWYKVSCIPFTSLLNYLHTQYFFSPGGWNDGLTSFLVTVGVLAVFVVYLTRNWRNVIRDHRELFLFVYGLALISMPFSTTDVYMVSAIRYVMVSVPLFLYLGELLDHDTVRTLVTSSLVVLMTIYSIAYFNNYFFVV